MVPPETFPLDACHMVPFRELFESQRGQRIQYFTKKQRLEKTPKTLLESFEAQLCLLSSQPLRFIWWCQITSCKVVKSSNNNSVHLVFYRDNCGFKCSCAFCQHCFFLVLLLTLNQLWENPPTLYYGAKSSLPGLSGLFAVGISVTCKTWWFTLFDYCL